MPHLAHELWSQLGHVTLLADIPWCEADSSLLTSDYVTIAVQINGKLRTTIDVALDADKADVEAQALAQDRVKSALAEKQIRKVIVVPNRIVNIVV